MSYLKSIFCSGLSAVLLFACSSQHLPAGSISSAKDSATGLKDYYRHYFPVGVAVSPASLQGDEAALILREFNSLTPENCMKMGPIHPKENIYYWKDADSIIAFAQRHQLKVRGHNLCWHEQTPAWLFVNTDGSRVSKEVLLQRLKEHIYTVVSRYKGKIYAWDVVNEAIDDNPNHFLRNSLWYQVCGEEFIYKAFQYAHEADPDAVLFYNDYNTERPEKTARVYRLLKQLKDAGIPVHGVGLQAHWSLFEPTQQELVQTIRQFASLGLQVQVTELDMSVYPWEKERRTKRASDDDHYTPEREAAQARQYKMVFDVFRQYRRNITGVTFWNVSDRYTWLDHYPVEGRKNYPLLFDTLLQPKKAYREVVQF
jgi:endo-1,4-beta-xylanase